MKNRKIILGAMVLSVPVATAITAISMSINHNNNELNSANSKYAIDSSKLYATDSSIEALNPDTIVTFGQRQSFSRSEYWTLWTNIYNNLKTNYYYINEVKKFVTNSTYEHISKYFTTPKLIQELNQLVKGINHVDKFQSKRQWFSMKTPSNSVALERGEGITTPVNTFTPLVAEFDSRTLGVFKVRIDTLGSSGLQLKNGTQHLSLYLHNDAAQFNSNKSITDLINSHDIFLRDEERNSPFNKIESADFISVKRSGTKIQVFLKMKPNDQVKLMVDSVDSKTSSAAIKGGFLNSSESNFGVNMTNPPSFDPIGIYSYAGNYSKKQINFSLAPGKTTKTNIPVYFKGVKNDENLVFSLPERGNLAITPKKLNVEKSIINPTNDDSITKGDNPLNVETSSDGNNVFVNINFGADGDIYSKTESSKNKIQFENLGVQPWQKIFFENIVNMKNAKNETRKIDFVSYSDPDSESKRILAEIFSQWLQVDDKHISPFPGQTKDLSFNMYNITHNNYSKIKISEEPTVLKNMDGVNIIKKIKEQEKLVNDIYAKTGFNKYIPKNDLFSPATDYGMVLKNMYPWLYAYSDNYKTTISNLTKLIELNKENLNNADVKKKLNNEAEGIILNLVQRRIDAYLNNFKRVMLQRIYEYFGKALKLNATKGDQIIAKDAFVEKTVLSPDKQNVNGIVFKNNLKLVPVDKKTSSSYLQSVINRILNMIKTYHFDNYLVENIVDFQNNISKITNPDTYLDKTKDLSETDNAFSILRYIFKMYGINTNDWIEYSATKPSEFNESKMMSMIKDKIVEFQRAFIYDRRNISFFGRNFNVSKMDSLVTAVNTKTIVDEIKLIESKKGQNSARYKKLQEITNSKLYADSSIEKFAVSLEKYNIKDYIDLYSNNPEKLVKDIWNLDIQNMDYNLSKPLTPGYFGEVLSHSKEISGAIFMGFGLLFMIMSSLGIYTVKRKNEYSYNKMRVDELFKNNQNAVIRKNKWIRVSLGGLLVLSAIVLLIGILITSGVVAPAIFIL